MAEQADTAIHLSVIARKRVRWTNLDKLLSLSRRQQIMVELRIFPVDLPFPGRARHDSARFLSGSCNDSGSG